MSRSPPRSQHPTDQLIRALVRARRPATPAEVEQILDRLATAPFDPQIRPVPPAERGKWYGSITLGARARSLDYHLVKRVAIEAQWAYGTMAVQYVDDLRRAVRHADARLTVYKRRGGHLAAAITPTDRVLPPTRRGFATLPHLLVVYSADRGIILTGYQFSTLDRTGIPLGVLWLK